MAENKFVLRITKDANGQDIDIKAMSLETVKKFMVLAEAFTKIVELTPNNQKITLSITGNSIGMVAEGEDVKTMKEQYEKAKEGDMQVRSLFQPYNAIQSLISANGYEFEAIQFTDGEEKSIQQELKDNGVFKSKPEKKIFNFFPIFVTGYFYEGGGKVKKNLHIQTVESDKTYKVACTPETSRRARKFLEGTIFISAWKGSSTKGEEYLFCDAYDHPNMFNELKKFIDDIRDKDEIEVLSEIHDKIRQYIDKKYFGRLRKLIRLFLHESVDINILNEFLLLTPSVRHEEKIKDEIIKMEALFNEKMSAYKKINPKNSWLL